MQKIIKILLIISWILIVALHLWLSLYNDFSILNSLIYWWVLFSWILSAWQFKTNSRKSYQIVSVLFILSTFNFVIANYWLSEIIMRISFIGLTVGFIQNLLEYNKISHN